MNVVWLKRDVRFADHEPLSLAAAEELPCLVVYIYEPAILQSDTYHESHHKFINEGLTELNSKLKSVSVGGDGGLTFRTGDAVDVLQSLHSSLPIRTLFSHREVGHGISLKRNERVAAWAQAAGVLWRQCQQDGVCSQRHGELDEGSWANKWTQQMLRAQQPSPSRLLFLDSHKIQRGVLADAASCSVKHLGLRPSAQTGGETAAQSILRSFLDRRGEGYCDELSSPLTGWDSCSRLSPYLSWGHISLRAVFQALSSRQDEVRGQKKQGRETGRWLKSLAALASRLRWRSHFSQKLWDQPSIEHDNMCRAYDGLRAETDHSKLEAWADGRTGFPMVDACMRSLNHSGWLNFRMRAMLVSFACYDLWLDWRPLAPILARLFLDYEPGIHYPQLQMQAGTTGINANRIYNVTKQAADHAGADYVFIRRWVPELSRVPARYIAEPHAMPLDVQHACGCIIGTNYPPPIADRAASYLHARSEFAKVKGRAQTKAEAVKVFEQHGSRKPAAVAPSGTKRKAAPLNAAAIPRQPICSSIVAAVQEEAIASSAAAEGMRRNPRRKLAPTSVGITSFFVQVSKKVADEQIAAATAAVAAAVTTAATPAKIVSAGAKRKRSAVQTSPEIHKLFGVSGGKSCGSGRSSKEIIIIDD
jgi:deoxyribodipyrimidine photo-lyase